MRSCRLLYSKKDMRKFLDFGHCGDCTVFTMVMDAQPVFILRFDDSEVQRQFDDFVEHPDPTLLGCMEYQSPKLKESSIEEMRQFVNGSSQYTTA